MNCVKCNNEPECYATVGKGETIQCHAKGKTMKDLSMEEVGQILNSSATRKMVYEILELAKRRDPVDVYHDTLCAAQILKARMDQQLNRTEWVCKHCGEISQNEHDCPVYYTHQS